MQQVTKRLFNFRYRYFFIMNTELDPKEYLLKIVNSVAVLLLWPMPNLFFGLYKGYAFFENRPQTANYIYYTVSAITFALVILFFIKKWKK